MGSSKKGASREQVERREMGVFEAADADRNYASTHMEGESGIYYMDAQGQFWDEVSNKKLEKNGVISARLGTIRLFHAHGVCKKAPLKECWTATGCKPIKVKGVDINKVDEAIGGERVLGEHPLLRLSGIVGQKVPTQIDRRCPAVEDL